MTALAPCQSNFMVSKRGSSNVSSIVQVRPPPPPRRLPPAGQVTIASAALRSVRLSPRACLWERMWLFSRVHNPFRGRVLLIPNLTPLWLQGLPLPQTQTPLLRWRLSRLRPLPPHRLTRKGNLAKKVIGRPPRKIDFSKKATGRPPREDAERVVLPLPSSLQKVYLVPILTSAGAWILTWGLPIGLS